MWLPSGSVSSSAGIPTTRPGRAHRYPRPHHYVLKYSGLARAFILLRYRYRPPATPATASAITSRLILAAPRSTGVQKASNQGPGTRLRAQGAGQDSLQNGCALLAPKNEDVSEQKNHFTPNTNNTQKAKNRGSITPAPGVVSLIPQTAPVGAGLVPALASFHVPLPHPPNPSRRGRPCACPRPPPPKMPFPQALAARSMFSPTPHPGAPPAHGQPIPGLVPALAPPVTAGRSSPNPDLRPAKIPSPNPPKSPFRQPRPTGKNNPPVRQFPPPNPNNPSANNHQPQPT